MIASLMRFDLLKTLILGNDKTFVIIVKDKDINIVKKIFYSIFTNDSITYINAYQMAKHETMRERVKLLKDIVHGDGKFIIVEYFNHFHYPEQEALLDPTSCKVVVIGVNGISSSLTFLGEVNYMNLSSG